LRNAACITSQTVLKSIPSTSIEKSSANPCEKYSGEFSVVNNLSATMIHIRAESTPPLWKALEEIYFYINITRVDSGIP